jgi:hypothetical protein
MKPEWTGYFHFRSGKVPVQSNRPIKKIKLLQALTLHVKVSCIDGKWFENEIESIELDFKADSMRLFVLLTVSRYSNPRINTKSRIETRFCFGCLRGFDIIHGHPLTGCPLGIVYGVMSS